MTSNDRARPSARAAAHWLPQGLSAGVEAGAGAIPQEFDTQLSP